MTRNLTICAVTTLIIGLAACGAGTDPPADQSESVDTNQAMESMPDDDVHAEAMAADAGGADHSMGINREVNLSDDVVSAWSGVTIRLVDVTTGLTNTIDVDLGSTVALGDSGLTLTAETFIPAFVMDDSGITSTSREPTNPAVKVVIVENGKDPYQGWLFATMPEIHPFPHDRYQVLLVEGIPSD